MNAKKFALPTELMSNAAELAEQTVAHKRHRGKRAVADGLIEAVIGGERVLLALSPDPKERGIQIQIVTALGAAGIRVMPHTVVPCYRCGAKPNPKTGLGVHAADLICVVPPYGRFCAIEVKRPKTRAAKRDENQRRWAHWIRHYGGVAGVATNVDEAFELIALARRLP